MDYCRHHITSSTQTILLQDRSYLSHSESEQCKLRDSSPGGGALDPRLGIGVPLRV